MNKNITLGLCMVLLFIPMSLAYETDQTVFEKSSVSRLVGDSLNYDINLPKFSEDSNTFSWVTKLGDKGINNAIISVSDGKSIVTKEQVIEVKEKQLPPIIEDINDITIDETELMTVSVKATDYNNDKLTYFVDDKRIKVNENKLSWQTNYEDSGSHKFTVKVSDGTFEVSKSFDVNVNNVNRDPSIDDISIELLEYRTNILVVASDPDGEQLKYEIPGLVKASQNEFVILNPVPGEYSYTAKVSDRLKTVEKEFSFIISKKQVQPVVENINNVVLNENEVMEITVNAFDDNGDNLIYSVNDNKITVDKNKLSWQTNYEDAGSYDFTLIVSDGKHDVTKDFKVLVKDVNRLPKLQNIKYIVLTEIDLVTIKALATDDDGDALSYSINDTKFSQNDNVFTWQPTYQDNGIYYVELVVSDGSAKVSQDVKITLTEVNLNPTLGDLQEITVKENDLVKLIVEAEDINDDNLVYSIDDDRFDVEGNVFTWQTTYEDSGSYVVTITVSDGELVATSSTLVVVENINRLPTIEDIKIKQVENDVEVNLVIEDLDKEELSTEINELTKVNNTKFKLIDPLPGEYKFTVKVSDSSVTVEENFTINVMDNNIAPLLENIKNIEVEEYQEITIELNASDEDELNYYGDNIFTQNGNIFTWLPDYLSVGIHKFIFGVTDGKLSNEKEVSVTVIDKLNNEYPILENIDDISAYTNQEVVIDAVAEDIDGIISKYDWIIDGDVESNEQQFKYTFEDDGEYEASLIVTDNDEAFTRNDFNIFIVEDNVPVCKIISESLGYLKTSFDVECSGNKPFTYSWNLDKEEKYFVYNFPQEGTYDIEVTVCDNENDCATTKSQIETEENEGVFVLLDHELTVEVIEGNEPLTYNWSINKVYYPSENISENLGYGYNDVFLKVCDRDNDCGDVNVLVFNQEYVDVSLNPGWSLIGANEKMIVPKECGRVWTYDGTWNNNTDINAGQGIWVLPENGCELTLGKHSMVKHNNLNDGWNLVSIDSILDDGYVRDVCRNDLTKIWIYNGTWIKPDLREKIDFEPYLGAWVLCGRDDGVDISPSISKVR